MLDILRAGDVVVVKGSNGSRLAPIVTALKQRQADRHEADPQKADAAPADA